MKRFFTRRVILVGTLAALPLVAASVAAMVYLLTLTPPSPPTILVECKYPGATAEVLAATIAAPIERHMSGVAYSQSMTPRYSSDGTYQLTVTFDRGTELAMARILVLNRANIASPELPEAARATVVVREVASGD